MFHWLFFEILRFNISANINHVFYNIIFQRKFNWTDKTINANIIAGQKEKKGEGALFGLNCDLINL